MPLTLESAATELFLLEVSGDLVDCIGKVDFKSIIINGLKVVPLYTNVDIKLAVVSFPPKM